MHPSPFRQRPVAQALSAHWLAWLCLLIGILCGAGLVYFALRTF